MGRTMSTTASQPTDTATALVEHRASVAPLMIPGTFEVRIGPRQSPAGGRPVAGAAPPAAANNRERLEREREGGGAPSQRRGQRRGTIGTRLWCSLLHPTALPEIWRYVQSDGV